jgi:hypothetical protein
MPLHHHCIIPTKFLIEGEVQNMFDFQWNIRKLSPDWIALKGSMKTPAKLIDQFSGGPNEEINLRYHAIAESRYEEKILY